MTDTIDQSGDGAGTAADSTDTTDPTAGSDTTSGDSSAGDTSGTDTGSDTTDGTDATTGSADGTATDTTDTGSTDATDTGTTDTGSTDTTDTGSTDTGTADTGTTDGSSDGSADTTGTDGSGTDTTGTDGSGADATGTDATGADTTGTDGAAADDAANDGSAATADGSSSADDASTAEDTATTDAATGSDGSSGDASGATDGSASTASGSTGSTTGSATGSTSAGSTGASTGTSGTSGAAAGSSVDPGPPYLFADVYSGDMGRLPGHKANWTVLASTKNFCGAILKAWDGTTFNDGGWFKQNWPALKAAGADRYGKTWFRGAYLFLEFLQDGAKQADAYLAAIDAAGGWDQGDIIPIIDVEQGGASHPNRKASPQQIIDCTTACANRIRQRTNRRVMLYGRGAMRDLHINNRMGCDAVWNPAWTPTMVRTGLEAWSLEEIVLWQYCGDGQAAIATLPHSVAGFGATDLSVFVKGAQRPTIDLVRGSLL